MQNKPTVASRPVTITHAAMTVFDRLKLQGVKNDKQARHRMYIHQLCLWKQYCLCSKENLLDMHIRHSWFSTDKQQGSTLGLETLAA